MKKRAKITLIMSLAAFAASVYSLAAAAAYQPSSTDSNAEPVSSDESNYTNSVSSEQFRTKIIKIYNGHVAVFEENSDTPIEILETNADELPSDTVNNLNKGIIADTQDEYQSYMEDFS